MSYAISEEKTNMPSSLWKQKSCLTAGRSVAGTIRFHCEKL